MRADADIDHSLSQIGETLRETLCRHAIARAHATNDLFARATGSAFSSEPRIRARPKVAAATMPGLRPSSFDDACLHKIQFQRVFARLGESRRPEGLATMNPILSSGPLPCSDADWPRQQR